MERQQRFASELKELVYDIRNQKGLFGNGFEYKTLQFKDIIKEIGHDQEERPVHYTLVTDETYKETVSKNQITNYPQHCVFHGSDEIKDKIQCEKLLVAKGGDYIIKQDGIVQLGFSEHFHFLVDKSFYGFEVNQSLVDKWFFHETLNDEWVRKFTLLDYEIDNILEMQILVPNLKLQKFCNKVNRAYKSYNYDRFSQAKLDNLIACAKSAISNEAKALGLTENIFKN